MKTKMVFAALTLALLSPTGLRAGEGGWGRIRVPGGKYEVLMPGPPLEKTEKMPTPWGKTPFKMKWALDEDTGTLYVVGTFEFPKALRLRGGMVAKALDAFSDGFVKGGKGKLTRCKAVQVAGQPGQEFEAALLGGLSVARGRIYLIDGRLHLLLVMSPREDGDPRDADRFLQSFRPVAAIPGEPLD
jgi:hypothetical protein